MIEFYPQELVWNEAGSHLAPKKHEWPQWVTGPIGLRWRGAVLRIPDVIHIALMHALAAASYRTLMGCELTVIGFEDRPDLCISRGAAEDLRFVFEKSADLKFCGEEQVTYDALCHASIATMRFVEAQLRARGVNLDQLAGWGTSEPASRSSEAYFHVYW
ncbi:hypothetical protein [uncultured Maricaulis sp.]|uniref:hypothetical protein n=1 Tax=uncultured Maricaulis sp. TaxID=174710 RepID=UPI0030DD49D9|tara:strand:- start:28285 stop:28764 length:480 start_codon:yes stop_codon:yes gene_type:complete